MKKIYLFLILINFKLLAFVQNSYTPEGWTNLYKKNFSRTEINSNQSKSELIFSKIDTMPFSQLIFSWNAERPIKGYLSFWVQARNAKTKEWFCWHKMMDWGHKIQKSYLDKRKNGSSYFYVRLEIPTEILSDAFKIKVVSHNGASLSSLKSLGVSVTNFTKFKPELINDKIINLASVEIKNIPKISQKKLEHPKSDSLCSPTSCTMLIGFLNKGIVDPIDFANSVYDSGLDSYGSWPFNTAYAYEQNKDKKLFAVSRLNSFEQLHSYLLKGIPMVVSVRGNLIGGAKEYDNGHLLLVIGWDKKNKKVICHDPAFDTNENVLRIYDINSFIKAWEKSRRLAYIVR